VAIEARDAQEVAFTTHRLRGQASTLGADALVAATDATADAASTGNWSAADTAIHGVEREFERLLEALAESGTAP
jgi:HPt (histidine-containing phosphotransfer) domain-containing protein